MKVSDLLNIAFEVSGLDRDLALSKSRVKDYVKIRQLIVWFIYHNFKKSLSSIGDVLSQDHATIIYSINQIDNLEFQRWLPYSDWKSEIQKRIDSFNYTGKKLIEISNCSECHFNVNNLCELISEYVEDKNKILTDCPLKNA